MESVSGTKQQQIVTSFTLHNNMVSQWLQKGQNHFSLIKKEPRKKGLCGKFELHRYWLTKWTLALLFTKFTYPVTFGTKKSLRPINYTLANLTRLKFFKNCLLCHLFNVLIWLILASLGSLGCCQIVKDLFIEIIGSVLSFFLLDSNNNRAENVLSSTHILMRATEWVCKKSSNGRVR